MSLQRPLGSIRNRVIAGVILLHALFTGFIVHDVVHRERDFLVQRVAADGNALALGLAANAADWLITNDVNALGELTGSLSGIGDLRDAQILDLDGRVRATRDRTLFNLVLQDAASADLLAVMARDPARNFHQSTHDGTLDTIAEVTAQGRRVGYARVILDLGGTDAEVAQVTRRGLGFALAAILGGALLTWAVVGRISRRLDRLTAGAIAIGRGELEVSVPCDETPDEVGTLARAFARMTRALREDAARREQAERALRASEAGSRLLAMVVEQSHDAIFTKDLNGIVTSWNRGAERLYGYSAAEAVGRPLRELQMSRLSEEEYAALLARIRSAQSLTFEAERTTRDGARVYISVNTTPLFDDAACHIGEISISRDITGLKQAEAALFAARERAQVTLQSIGDGVITTGTDGCVDYLNPVAEQLTGWTLEAARGRPLAEVFAVVHEQSRAALPDPVERVLREGRILELSGQTLLIARDGRELPIQDSAAPIRDRDGSTVGVVLVFSDVSEHRRLAQKVAWQASHDALTGLINRREFEARLARALALVRSHNNRHALLYLDLDQFKVVNDTCGHFAGDQLLRQLAVVLQSRVREEDTIARLGGDEFGVLLEHCPIDDARRIAENLRQAVQDFRFAWQDKTFQVGVSIGAVAIDDHAQTLEKVLVAADAACYVAKDKGRNRIWVHHPDDDETSHRQGEMAWVSRITRAASENRLCLYGQSIAPVTGSQRGLHFEVLLRMRDENGGLVPPMAFIPAAERYGLMSMLDRWVVQHTLEQCAARFGPGAPGLHKVAINLSGASLGDDKLLDFVREQFGRYPVPPHKVCFEITETAAIANLAEARRLIGSLQALGCHFALDDFGSGMSSFTYLKNLPVNYLKIDGSFVKDMAQDPIDLAMVQAINDIGHVMGIGTIAEFVDGEEVLGLLRAMRVDYAQGYGIAMPAPLDEVLAAASPARAPAAA